MGKKIAQTSRVDGHLLLIMTLTYSRCSVSNAQFHVTTKLRIVLTREDIEEFIFVAVLKIFCVEHWLICMWDVTGKIESRGEHLRERRFEV
jgi:hypothetical protein